MAVKLYNNQAWLRRKYLVDKKTPEEIAELCKVDRRTVYRSLKKFGLLKSTRLGR